MKPLSIKNRWITHEFDRFTFTKTLRLLAALLVLAMELLVTTGCANPGASATVANDDPSPTTDYYKSSEDPFHSD